MLGLGKSRRTLALAAAVAAFAVLALPALASPPRSGGRYVGETSQLRTMTVKVSQSGKRVVAPSIVSVDLTCPNNTEAFGSIQPLGARIRAGKFSFRGSDTLGRYTFHARMTGRFLSRGRFLEGELSLRRVSSTGRVCRSGDVSYSARLKRR